MGWGKKSNFAVEKPSKGDFNQGMKVNTIRGKLVWWEGYSTCMVIFPKMNHPSSLSENHRVHSAKHRTDTPQNCPSRKKARKLRLEEPKETWWLTVMWSPGWGPGREKGRSWENEGYLNKVQSLVNSNVPVLISLFWQMNLGVWVIRGNWNFLSSLCNFPVYRELFQK